MACGKGRRRKPQENPEKMRAVLHFSNSMGRLSLLRGSVPPHLQLLAGWTLGAVGVYVCTWPGHVLIADEVAYLNDALRLLKQPLPCEPPGWSGYPPGTAGVVAGLVRLVGQPIAAFGVGLFSWLLGLWALGGLFWRWGKPVAWAFYPSLFAPGLVLTRSLMSDVPSFGLSAVFLWAYAGYGRHRTGALGAGVCAGAALLFRETNALWVLPFLVGSLFRARKAAVWLWAGFLLGLAGRLGWAYSCFGHWAYVRDPGVDFSLAYLPRNMAFYASALVVLCPAGLLFLWNKKVPLWPEVMVAVVATLALYSSYGYDAFAKSGSLKGVVLQGRFVLPLVPFLAWAGAFSTVENARWIRWPVLPLWGGAFWTIVHVGGFSYNQQQQQLTDALLRQPTVVHWSLSYDESRKYLNALHGELCLRPAMALRPPDGESWIHLFTRDDSADWHKKNTMASAVLEQWRAHRKLTLIFDDIIADGTRLRIWKVSPALAAQ